MGVLLELQGTSIKEMPVFFISKISEIENITTTQAATAAGSNGAINIWIDDDGHFRCESMRFYSTLDKQVYSDVNKVKQWAKKWLKEINIES